MVSTTPTVSANPSWWDNNWTKRSTVLISPMNPENFQIKIVIPSYIPTSDYPSIRFLENETTGGPLPYWIERSEGSYVNVAWVRRLENADNTIYMYYHNAAATSLENGDNVFLFFTDFGSTDNAGWSSFPESGSVTWETNTVHIVGAGGNKPRIEGQFSGLAGQEDYRSVAKTIEFRVKNAGTYRGGMLLSGSGWGNVEYAGIYDLTGYRFYQDGSNQSDEVITGDRFYIGRVDMWGSDNTRLTTTFSWGMNDENYEKLMWRHEKDKDWTYANGGDYVDKIVLSAWDSGTSSYYYDWIFMRRIDNRGMGNTIVPAEIYGYVDQSQTTLLSNKFDDATNTAARYDNWFAGNNSGELENSWQQLSSTTGGPKQGLGRLGLLESGTFTYPWISTPAIVTTGYKNIRLSFVENLESSQGRHGDFIVQWSNDNTKWNLVQRATYNDMYTVNWPSPTAFNCILVAPDDNVANKANIWIRWFNTLQTVGSGSRDIISFDNVVITGDPIVRGASVSITPSLKSGMTGENLVYTVNVQNAGNYTDNFDLAKGDSAGWTIGGVPANTGSLGPGDNYSGQVFVVVGGSQGDNDNVWVQAISKADNTKVDNKSVIAHNLMTGVSVSISPSSQSGANGAKLSYTITVTNTGEVTDNFNLSFGDNAGWNPQINKTLLTSIGPGASDNTTIENVTIPSGAIGGTIDNVWVQATSQKDNTKKDNKSATGQVTVARSVSASISPSIQSGENGATLTYTVTINNTGNVSDNYSLTPTDNASPSWSPSVLPTSLGIAAFSSDNATLSVTIPSGAIDGDEDNLTVTANGTGDSASANTIALCTIEVIQGVSVSISPSSKSGANGATLTYTVTVTNTGNASDNYSLVVTDSENWSPSVLPTSIVIPAFSSDNATLSVTIPSNAIGGTVDNIMVTASGDVSDNDTCIAQVDIARSVNASITPSSQSGNNGAVLTYTVTINNTGNVSDNYSLTPTDNENWSPSVLPTSIVVPAFSSDNATLSVTIPSNAIGGTTDNIKVTANGTGDSASANCTATLDISRSVSVTIAPSSQNGANGATLNYTVTINNTGNVSDNYALTVTDNAVWTPSVSPTSRVVAAFSSDNATLSVTIPLGAIGGTTDNIIVTATSQADNNVKDNDSATATVTTVYGVQVSISPATQYGLQGDNLTYTVTVKNTGNVDDSYNITTGDNASPSWNPTTDNGVLAIPVSGTSTTTLRVTAGSRQIDSIWVAATSVGSPSTSDNKSVTANASWAYRRKITISPLNPENFQVKVVIPSDIPKSDYPSIRFLENKTQGVLPYWIERNEANYINAGADPAWVRRLENDDDTIYMYYHNASATSAENMDNVFVFSDDFGGSTNSGKWDAYTNGGSITFEATTVHITGGSKARIEHGEGRGLPQSEESLNRTIEFRIKNPQTNRGGLLLQGNGWNDVEYACIFDVNGGRRFWQDGNQSGTIVEADKYFIGRVDMYNTDQLTTTFYTGNDNTTYRTQLWTSNKSKNWTRADGGDYVDKYTLATWDSGSDYYFDWFFVRKWAATEPVATVGAQESAYGVTVSISPSSQNGANGTTLNCTVTVTNTGAVQDNYVLTVGDSAGWSPSVLPTSVVLAAGSSENTTTLSVTIPSLAIGGTTDNIWVQATSQGDNTANDNKSATAQADIARSVSVSIAPSDNSGANGALLHYTVTVNNTGNVNDIYTLTPTDNAIPTWSPSVPSPLAVSAFSSGNATLSVTIPGNAIGGTSDNITVTANGTGDSASANCTATLNISTSVSVSISPSFQSGANGATLTYTVIVTNTGNVSDNYSLTPTDNENWSPSVLPTSLVVPAFSSDNATLSVTIPSNAIGGTIDNIKVTANGTGDNASSTCTATVNIARGVSVSISPSSQSGANGATLTYTVTVTNNGNVSDNFSLTPSDDAGWLPSVLPTSLAVAPFGGSDNATLSVTIPTLAIGGTTDNITVTADDLLGASDSDGCTAELTVSRGVSVSISPSSQSGANGETLTYTVAVTNTGNVSDNYSLTPSDDAGWSPSVLPTSLVVAPFGSSENATLSVTIPLDATGGTVDNLSVTADDLLGASDSDTCTATLNISTSVSVSITPSSQSGADNATLIYTVTVTNTGNVSDTYTLENTDTLGWTLGLSNTTVGPISPSASDNSTTLSVTIPLSATGGTTDNITVTANGTGDNASSSCTATAITGTVEFSLELVAGWNLVCFPVTAVTNTPENIFAGLTWGVDYNIYSWTAPGGPYILIGPTDVLQDNLAYWVLVTSDQTITWNGTQPTSRDVYLVTGWNMAGFPIENASTTPSNIFTGMTWGVDYNIYSWTAPGGPYILLGPTDLFVDNTGYWVYVNADKVVTVP